MESTPNQGSTFWFTVPFPIAAAPVELAHPGGLREERQSIMFDASVLVVEDNPVNQTVTKSMLESLGVRVDLAATGLEAVELVKTNRYNLVFMDCQMPKMDGYEAAQSIRVLEQNHRIETANTQNAQLPVIAMTANALKGEREKCLQAGMDDYISKPFTIIELESILKTWLPFSTQAVYATDRNARTYNKTPRQKNGKPKGFQAIQLEYLRSIQSIDPNNEPVILRTSIESYLQYSRHLLESMQEYLATGNFAELSNSAHNMNSSSLNMGALSLSEYCSRLEVNATKTETHELQDLYNRIQTEYRNVEEELCCVLSWIEQNEF